MTSPIFNSATASSAQVLSTPSTEVNTMIATSITSADVSAQVKAGKILKDKSLAIFDKFDIPAIPLEWFERGLIILNDLTPGSPQVIGKVLLRKLVQAGIEVKVANIKRDTDSKTPGSYYLELVDSKIRCGHSLVSSLNEEGVGKKFQAATVEELNYMPIYGVVPQGLSELLVEGENFDIRSYCLGTVFGAMAVHIADSIQSLSLKDRVEVAGAVAKKPLVTDKTRKKQPWNVIKVVPQNTRFRSYGEAIFTFKSEHEVCVETTRERWCNANLDLYGKTYDGSTIVCILIMGMTSERLVSQRQIDGWLGALSSLWVREDNYGAALQYDDVLAFISRNSHKTIAAGPTLSDEKGRYPHFALINDSFNVDIMNSYISQGVPVIPDKYATERLAFGAGARAMMIDTCTAAEAAAEFAGYDNGGLVVEPTAPFTIMPHDVAKGEAKLFNRPGQAFGANFADSWSEDFPLEATAMRIWTGEEYDAVFRGFRLNAVISNSLFGNGSGAASCRPGFARPVAVGKKISGYVHGIQIPAASQAHLIENAAAKGHSDWIEEFIPTLAAKCQALIGQVFKYGDEVLSLWDAYPEFRRVVISMKDFNQEVRVRSFEIKRLGTSNTLQVVLDVVLEYADNGIKWRGPGLKATTVRENMNFSDEVINEGWELFFPYESLKGRLLQAFMYGNAMEKDGYAVLYKRGKIYITKGEEVIVSDLSINAGTHFEQWVKEKVKLVTVVREVAKSHYDRVLASNGGILPHVKVLGDTVDTFGPNGTAGGYVIEEQVQVLYGDIHAQIEVSTPRECTSAQSCLLEGLAMNSAMSLIHSNVGDLGMDLWAGSADYRDGILRAIDMSLGGAEKEGVSDLTDADYEYFQFMIKGKKGAVLTGRDLMRNVAKHYPSGIRIHTNGGQGDVATTYIDATAFLQLGSFGTGGSASGVALEMCELIHIMAKDPADRVVGWDNQLHGMNKRVAAALKSWMGMGVGQGVLNSKSVLKRLARTNKVEVALKIQTSFHPVLENHYFENEAGEVLSIPTVLLHPDCDSVKLGDVQEGDVVAIKRTPMISAVYCRVKISAEHGLVAYARMLPEVWAEGNEGDTDGDGCSYLPAKSVSYELAVEFNNSVFSTGGYWFVYGDATNHPFAEFVSVKDAWNKKVLCTAEGLVPQAVLQHFGGKVKAPGALLQIKSCSYLVDAAHKVSSHYKVRVGTVYGWCSIIAFKVAELVYSLYEDVYLLGVTAIEEGGLGMEHGEAQALGQQVLKGNFEGLDEEVVEQIAPRYNGMLFHQEAATLIWRFGYEGLGLGGYSKEATAFFEAIDSATRPSNPAKGFVVDTSKMVGGQLEIGSAVPGGINDGSLVPIHQFLRTYFDKLADKADETLFILAECEELRRLYRNVERYGVERSLKNPKLGEAMMWGALRRATQGDDFIDGANFTSSANSCFQVVVQNKLALRHPFLNEAMQVCAVVHNDLYQEELKAALSNEA
jgi:hypothetical protein